VCPGRPATHTRPPRVGQPSGPALASPFSRSPSFPRSPSLPFPFPSFPFPPFPSRSCPRHHRGLPSLSPSLASPSPYGSRSSVYAPGRRSARCQRPVNRGRAARNKPRASLRLLRIRGRSRREARGLSVNTRQMHAFSACVYIYMSSASRIRLLGSRRKACGLYVHTRCIQNTRPFACVYIFLRLLGPRIIGGPHSALHMGPTDQPTRPAAAPRGTAGRFCLGAPTARERKGRKGGGRPAPSTPPPAQPPGGIPRAFTPRRAATGTRNEMEGGNGC
jgi:hypothetical protein